MKDWNLKKGTYEDVGTNLSLYFLFLIHNKTIEMSIFFK